MIRFIFTGKTKHKEIEALNQEYLQRLTKFTKYEVIEIKDEKVSKNCDEKRLKGIEADKILANIKEDEYIIALDETGKHYSSIDFAKFIEKQEIEHNIVLITGGSLGLSDKIKKRANLVLSFSKMTFGHRMIRFMLIEQIYRAYCINNGINYHK